MPALIIRDSVIPNPASSPLLITNAHIYINGGSTEIVLSYTWSDAIISWSSAFWLLRYSYSALIVARSLLILLIMLLYYVIVSLRLIMSFTTSSNPPLPPAHSGETDTRLVGNGGSLL